MKRKKTGKYFATGYVTETHVSFSARLHFNLVQKSYCYIPGISVGVGVRVSVGVHMQNVRANVKVLEFKFFWFFFLAF